MIYQLLRTSAYLSGQVRHDLIVDQDKIRRVVLAPIADSIAYNENEPRPLMNYKHVDNLKYMYNVLGDDFFRNTECFSGSKYIFNDGKTIDTHDYTYLSGLRRLRYQRYNKQYSFLAPMWISEPIDFSDIRFRVKLKGCDSDFINIENVITLDETLVNYYNEYFKDVNDDLLNFKLDTNEAYISGVDVQHGCYSVRDVSYVIENVLNREKPIMEVDNTFLTLFKDNYTVAKQLVNFNVVFDIFDLTTKEIVDGLVGKPLNITVEVEYKGNVVVKKDIYCNYDYIPATELVDNKIRYISENVLTYLDDHHNIDYVYKNKLTQPIFHWALLENKEYTYNLYDGFAPNINIDGEYYRICGQYYNQGDLTSERYDVFDNNLAWCDYSDYSSMTEEALRVQIEDDDANDLYTDIDLTKEITWFNNNKYDINGIDSDWETISVRIIKVRETHNPRFSNTYIELYNDNGVKIYTYTMGRRIVFIIMSAVLDHLTIGFLKNIVIDDNWGLLCKVLNGYIKPYKIIFQNTTVPHPVQRIEGVDRLKEIEYYKLDENYSSYVYRYFGKLIPHFIDPNGELRNWVYYYEQWSMLDEDYMKDYNKWLLKGYIPNYPSLTLSDGHAFYALRSEEYKPHRGEWYKDWLWEVCHAFDNKAYVLPTTVTMSVEVVDAQNKTEDDINVIIDRKITETFVNEGFNEESVQYITELYQKEINFDYKSITNVNDIIYKIKFKLR